MAEGGYDEFEMGDLGESFPEYDDMDDGELNNRLLDLRNNLVNDRGDVANLTERIKYIEEKMLPSVEKTLFTEGENGVTISTGGEGEVNVVSALPRGLPTENSGVVALDKFIQDTHGVRVDWGSDEGIRLRKRLGTSSKGGVKYKSYIGGKEYVVLEWDKRNDTFGYRKGGGDGIKKAVQDFRTAINRLVQQSRVHEETARGMDMVDITHTYTPRRGLTDQENREHAGVLNPSSTIDKRTRTLFLREQEKYLANEAADTERKLDGKRKESLESFELHERKIDLEDIREETIAQRELEERIESLESLQWEYEEQATKEEVRLEQEEDIGRLERFKRWAKENMVGLSVVAISVAGIITTVIVAGRKAIMKGAQATSKFAKAVANLAKKLGPLLAPLLNMLATVISWGAKGLTWLAQNIWVLVIAVAFFLYREFSKRKK